MAFRFFSSFSWRHFLFSAGCGAIGLVMGFGLGIYTLPILTAEEGLSGSAIAALAQSAGDDTRTGQFVRDLPDSDAFHWGDGTIYVSAERIWLDGTLAPGPDYRLYLTPEFIDTEAGFLAVKSQSAQIAPIKAFSNFSADVPAGISVADYKGVLVWCERFGQFITSAEIR